MADRKAVLFRGGEPQYVTVGVKPGVGFYPYVMFADELYVRWEQGDQHEKLTRIPAYMWAEFYEVG